MNKTLTLLLAASLAAGCALAPQKKPYEPKLALNVKNSVDPILGYARQFAEFSPERQRRELTLLNQKLTAHGDPVTRLTAAVLYALPANRSRDLDRALALFDEAVRSKALDPGAAELAGVMRDFALDAQRQAQENQKLAQKVRDEQKQSEALQKQSDALQKKLDELKNIEKAMGTR